MFDINLLDCQELSHRRLLREKPTENETMTKIRLLGEQLGSYSLGISPACLQLVCCGVFFPDQNQGSKGLLNLKDADLGRKGD